MSTAVLALMLRLWPLSATWEVRLESGWERELKVTGSVVESRASISWHLGRTPDGGGWNMRENGRNKAGWVGNFKKEEYGVLQTTYQRQVADLCGLLHATSMVGSTQAGGSCLVFLFGTWLFSSLEISVPSAKPESWEGCGVVRGTVSFSWKHGMQCLSVLSTWLCSNVLSSYPPVFRIDFCCKLRLPFLTVLNTLQGMGEKYLTALDKVKVSSSFQNKIINGLILKIQHKTKRRYHSCQSGGP